MAIDRAEVRRRVRTISSGASGPAVQDALPQTPDPQTTDPYSAEPAYPQGQQGFEPPSASTGPPQGMSGGS